MIGIPYFTLLVRETAVTNVKHVFENRKALPKYIRGKFKTFEI